MLQRATAVLTSPGVLQSAVSRDQALFTTGRKRRSGPCLWEVGGRHRLAVRRAVLSSQLGEHKACTRFRSGHKGTVGGRHWGGAGLTLAVDAIAAVAGALAVNAVAACRAGGNRDGVRPGPEVPKGS